MSEENKTPLLEVKNLKKWFPAKSSPFSKEKVFIKAVDGVSFTLDEGRFVVILGPSGAGKSTLLHLLGGLDSPTGGSIRVDGRDIAALRSNELADYRAAVQRLVGEQEMVSARGRGIL